MESFLKAYELLSIRKRLMKDRVRYNEIKKLDEQINNLPLQEVLDAQEFVNHF